MDCFASLAMTSERHREACEAHRAVAIHALTIEKMLSVPTPIPELS